MKRLIIIAIFSCFTLAAISQSRIIAPKETRDKTSIKAPTEYETTNFSSLSKDQGGNMDEYEDYYIGNTYYDLQTNASMQNRMFLYPDGFIGGTYTYGLSFPSFTDRGTGYNNFQSSDWGPFPTERLESDRCGWPSYAPWSSNGEMVVAHFSGAGIEGLVFSKRTTKGTGAWTEFTFAGPDGHSLLWPSMTTSGTNHETTHLLALTMPIANGGSIYEDQDGALVYSRSSDGGISWDIENTIINGLGSEYYNGFEGDTYEFAYPKANTLALLIGNDWTDLILLKSTDNGDTWTKTLIWEHPYPLFDPNNMIVTDTFYCADGSHSIAIDNEGKVHVAFGINRAVCDGETQYWFPFVDGVAYWNEDMPLFSNNLNALSPYSEPGTELIENYNLLGWMQDMNGNGELDLMDEIGTYYMGPSSMPQLVIDDQDQVFLIYSSVTETYESWSQNYRHLWARGSNNNGLLWGDFYHLTSDLIYTFTESVFPSCSPTTDENIHFLYQADTEPGLAVRGDEDPFEENYIHHYSVAKTDIIIPNPGNTLTGMVTEAEGGASIAGAIITLEETAYNTTSSSGGTYNINDIPAGSYTANCTKQGFIEAQELVVITNSNTTIQNFELMQIAEPEDAAIGETFYDLQSNFSMQNRMYKYDDGAIGGVWTYGFDFPTFNDRGTGYNFYNGLEWSVFPMERIESVRTGWPSYAPFGENGEMVVSHDFSAGSLYLLTREEKGEGVWTEQEFFGPSGTNISWNRTITSGNDFSTLQVLSLTWPVASGGTVYQGLDGALLYSRSTDGGATWDQENVILDGVTSGDYYGFSADNYKWAAKGNQIAFLVGSPWVDLFLMKSTDNGDIWTKTVVWEHPYPLFNTNIPAVTDTFYCADGAHSLSFDESGKIHVAFGLTRAYSDGTGTFTISEVDGIAYWNEDMTTFSNDLNALSPYGDIGSELIEDYNLIGWSQDINGNGELDILNDWGEYYLGLSSMPQLVIDEDNNIFLVYSSVTEGYDNAIQNYRHLWARGFNYNAQTWGEFMDLNEDLIYIFSECVFPSCSPTSDDQVHLIFMVDDEPGLAVRGDEDPYGFNNIQYMNIPKSDLIPNLEIGVLTGIVTEYESGNPISGAYITIQGTSFYTYSIADGSYQISDIPSGTYVVHCQKSGYVNETEVIEILGNNTTTQNFQMEEPSPTPENEIIGETWYDLQSNGSMQNRIYKYDDGTIGAVWTMGFDFPNFADRGTGYNYYDGVNWAPFPDDGIEPDRTGWPSYTSWGSNGEIVVAHYSGAAVDGLIISSRQNKGTGSWSGTNFFGPATNYYLWPRAMCGGNDHNDLHIIAITAPVANGGTTYQGMDGALLYSRSPDGGVSWDHQHVLMEEINSEYYTGFSGDAYEIQTQGNNAAFLLGDTWTDLILMKSTDNGDTWSKTIIWEHPYPLFDPGSPIVTDTFYCVDGAHSLAFDQSGKIHVAFGINRANSDGTGTYWFPDIDGIGYWNEDRPAFSDNLNALNPYGGPGSELVEDYSLVGWSQDINGNGELDLLDDWGTYYLGLSSMPQLVIDEMNSIFLVYSSVTEGYDNGIQNYRHLWARGSNTNGQTWGDFVHVTSELIYIFSECVFPSVSPTTDNNLHLIFQEDYEPGMAVIGDEDPFGENQIVYMNILKSNIINPSPGGFLGGAVTNAVSGDPIENATISLSGITFSAQTNVSGYYELNYIPPGDYSAVCSKMGYLNVSAEITIIENEVTTQDFELEVASTLDPPENLTATIFNQNNVLLEWDPPSTGTPTGYYIYRNNNIIGFSLSTSTNDNNLYPGIYSYFITAEYEIGESNSSNVEEVIITEPLLPPINFTVYVDDNDVLLMWDPPISGTPMGYNIYRDDIYLNFTANTIYADQDLDPGFYEYYLTAEYSEGESDPTEALEVYIPEPCNPPENVIATVINITEVELSWEPPTTGSPPYGYSIYQNGFFIDFTNSNEIYIDDLDPGTFDFCVTTECENGESEPACADPITIILFPPANLEAEISGSDIILSWDEPEEKALNGYNVYHKYENGNFTLFAYLTQSSCLYADADVGLHSFYVTAVYDEGESVPGDTVEVLITSVNNNFSNEIIIHPNPASEFVIIKSDYMIKTIKVYNHTGMVVGYELVNSKNHKLITLQYSSGLYFFQVTTSEGIISKRVIIE